MYLFEVNILYYVLAIILSTIIGPYIDYCAKTFEKGEKILSKNNFNRYKETFKVNFNLVSNEVKHSFLNDQISVFDKSLAIFEGYVCAHSCYVNTHNGFGRKMAEKHHIWGENGLF